MRVRLATIVLSVLAASATVGSAGAEGFRSPDDAIHCVWFDGTSPTCEVNWATSRPPYKPRTCEPQIDGLHYGLEDTGRTVLGCNMGDSVRDSSFPVLPYGESRRVGGVTCTMRRDGLRCENRSRHGFTLWRGRETLF